MELLSAAIWLVFLAFPAIAMITRDVSTTSRVVWGIGLVVFVGSYLGALLSILERPSRPQWLVMVVHTLVMLVGVALMVPASGPSMLYTTTYFVALWLYGAGWGENPRPGLIGAGVATLTGTVGALVWRPDAWLVLLLPQWLSTLLIVVTWAEARRERSMHKMSELVASSRQREQIARDVHDVLGHSLTVVALKTELARRLVHADPDRAAAELDEVLALTRRSLSDVRVTAGRLRTPDLGEQLAAAGTALRAAGVAPRLPRPEAADAVAPEHREVLAWCLREAVTNVVRHADAAHCTVLLEPGMLVVEDDGRGLGGAGGEAGEGERGIEGSGITGMRERVAQAGGTLSVGPGPERGTRVEVTL